jgi:hypothetical protein
LWLVGDLNSKDCLSIDSNCLHRFLDVDNMIHALNLGIFDLNLGIFDLNLGIFDRVPK